MLNFIQIKTTTFQRHCQDNEMARLKKEKKSLTIDTSDKNLNAKRMKNSAVQ